MELNIDSFQHMDKQDDSFSTQNRYNFRKMTT